MDQPAEPRNALALAMRRPPPTSAAKMSAPSLGDAAVGAAPGHRPDKRRPLAPADQVSLDGVRRLVADLDYRQVMAQGLGHGGLVEPWEGSHRLVGVGPGRPAPPQAPVAQQELPQPVARLVRSWTMSARLRYAAAGPLQGSSWVIPTTSGDLPVRVQAPHRDGGFRHVQPEMGRARWRHWPRPAPSVWRLRPLSVGDPPRCGPEPAAP